MGSGVTHRGYGQLFPGSAHSPRMSAAQSLLTKGRWQRLNTCGVGVSFNVLPGADETTRTGMSMLRAPPDGCTRGAAVEGQRVRASKAIRVPPAALVTVGKMQAGAEQDRILRRVEPGDLVVAEHPAAEIEFLRGRAAPSGPDRRWCRPATMVKPSGMVGLAVRAVCTSASEAPFGGASRLSMPASSAWSGARPRRPGRSPSGPPAPRPSARRGRADHRSRFRWSRR